jgi:very-short-patch-repair endonuclease
MSAPCSRYPSPLAGERGEDRRSEPGEGESRSHGASVQPPHPTPRSRSASPSPARGVGKEARVPETCNTKVRIPIVATTSNAPALRRSMTDAERKLWRVLRARQFAAAEFRRQEPIGPYVADFVCYKQRLVIEVDGGQHAESARDRFRDRWFEQNAFRVLRFWNNEVLNNLEGVSTAIISVLAERQNEPSPLAGEGGEDRRSEPGEGESRSHGASVQPPHPTPRSRSASPSPARGEGKRARQ